MALVPRLFGWLPGKTRPSPLVLPGVLLLAGCECFISHRAQGSISNGVHFELRPDASWKKGSVLDVYVHRSGPAVNFAQGETGVVWHVTGKAGATRVTYGQVPRGMTEVVSAAPLVPGQPYNVIIMARRSRFSPRQCIGHEDFAIDDAGSVVPGQLRNELMQDGGA